MPFPKIVMALSKDGVESYHVDYIRGEGIYYYSNNESLVEKYEHSFPEVNRDFSQEGIQKAIKNAQAGVSKYPDFIQESAAAGCSYYIVHITGKQVIYFGRNGQLHVEPFPSAK